MSVEHKQQTRYARRGFRVLYRSLLVVQFLLVIWLRRRMNNNQQKKIKERERGREREKRCTWGFVREKILISAHRWKASLVMVLLFLCRYTGRFKYRAVAIENWRAFRRRYFSPRGITEETDNILRRLLSIFTLARGESVVKDSATAECPRGVSFIAAILPRRNRLKLLHKHAERGPLWISSVPVARMGAFVSRVIAAVHWCSTVVW